MTGPDALGTIAEIAIALAGFSGIAAVLGRRGQGEWSRDDVYRLQALLFSSFTAVVFSFLPIVLILTPLAPPAVWALSSGAWLIALILIAVIRGTEARRISQATGEHFERRDFLAFGLPMLAMVLLHGMNVLVLREAWPYVAAAVCALAVPFSFFVGLLRAILTPNGGNA